MLYFALVFILINTNMGVYIFKGGLMKKYMLVLFFAMALGMTFNVYAIDDTRKEISQEMNSVVDYIKSMFRETNQDVHDSLDQSKDNKARAENLYKKSSKDETNPTVLNHAKKSIKACDYSTENLHWTGYDWDCIKINVASDCQPAPDEYRYQDSSGQWVCDKIPEGGVLKAYWKFIDYKSTCTEGLSYDKLYGCFYKNKLGLEVQISDSYCSGKTKPSIADKKCPCDYKEVAVTYTCPADYTQKAGKCYYGSNMVGDATISCQAGYTFDGVNCKKGSQYCPVTEVDPGNGFNPSYSWYLGPWGQCSANVCGSSGLQYRTVYCKDSITGAKVADGKCTGSKPLNSQPCKSSACTANPTYSCPSGYKLSGDKCSKSKYECRYNGNNRVIQSGGSGWCASNSTRYIWDGVAKSSGYSKGNLKDSQSYGSCKGSVWDRFYEICGNAITTINATASCPDGYKYHSGTKMCIQ